MTSMVAVEHADFDAGPADYVRALLNILEDFTVEKERLSDTQKAFQNIFEDFGSEKSLLESTQRAVLNILDDLAAEKLRLEESQMAVVESERAVRASLREKDLLLGEIHHRVKNNLQIINSLLDLQASSTTDDRAASALHDSQNRIQSMALIHQTLYQSHDFAKVDFGQFLTSLVIHLRSSYGRADIEMKSRADAVHMLIDRAIPCGLIVNELVTNALKHAFPGQRRGSIQVELRQLDAERVEVSVTDDGVGIPDGADLEALPSLGMRLVQVLSRQLDAELVIHRRNPTRIDIRF